MLEIAVEWLNNTSIIYQAESAYETAHFALGVQRDHVTHVQKTT
jgi:hypothetical protein